MEEADRERAAQQAERKALLLKLNGGKAEEGGEGEGEAPDQHSQH